LDNAPKNCRPVFTTGSTRACKKFPILTQEGFFRPRFKVHIKLLKTLSNKTKLTNKNEHVDGVTNSVQRPQSSELSKEDKQNLEQEIAEKFKLHANCIESWDSFVNKFYNEYRIHYPKIFKTKENLKTLNLIIDITDRGDICINNWEFYFSASFKGVVQLNFIDFYKTKYLWQSLSSI